MPARKRRVTRQRGRGFGDFLSNALSGLGQGLGRGSSNLLSGLFGGRRKRGGARRKRRMRGRGAGDVLSNLNKIAKDSSVISKALNQFGYTGLGSAASKLGYGRKRRMRGGYSLSVIRNPRIMTGMGATSSRMF